MFSANENILLRQHKRKVIEHIEATIPENALDMGTTVMVMQVSCRQPGCVPLETAITIVFPKPPRKKGSNNEETPSFAQPLIPGLEESRTGGSFKARILKPLSEVTNDDVLDALPPQFKGGKRTIESICLKTRDILFAQIGQLVGNDDTSDSRDTKKLVAKYLQTCLGEYMERECVAPEWGEDFAPLDKRKVEQSASQLTEENDANEATMDDKWGKGNIVFRRPMDVEPMEAFPQSAKEECIMLKQPTVHSAHNTIQHSVNRLSSAASSQELLKQLAEIKHAPGIRRPGCPCCEPDSASTFADSMML